MKTVVLANDLPMTDIIDSGVYEEYTRLLESDIADYFSENVVLEEVSCPGCGQSEDKNVYKKLGMTFKQCASCGSHYVSPRPSPKLQKEFYENSKACRFWRDQIAGLQDSQLYYIYGSRVNWMSELVDEFLSEAFLLMDFGTKYSFLLKHIQEKQIFKRIGTFQPELFEHSDSLPEDILCGENLNSYEGKVSVFTAFEVVERIFDPNQVFSSAARFCQQGGLLLLTVASCTGLEYQVLGKEAPNLNPINRMNLLSTEVLVSLVEKAGFEILEFSTPGRLDVDIVRRVIEKKKDLKIDPFWRYIFESRTEKTW
ncbi:MAG: hypothetical protein KAJ10_13230, partial [Thermodesulfovibrionia bacterium]|nr:hypothetical protein [Thermodesulfovibrionia bacterium]